MRPRCYNRPPFTPGRWLPTGRTVQYGTRDGGGGQVRWGKVKPVLRWHPRWFVDRCATHDGRSIGPNGENYAVANGYECGGCRWEPGRKV